MVRPQQIAPPQGWREAVVLEEGFLAAAPHLNCWNGQLLADWTAENHWLQRAYEKPQQLAIEFCSGNGAWIAERAQAEASYNWLAVERRFDRARKIQSKRYNQNIPNLAVAWGNAEHIVQHLIEEGSVERVFINFPDPWPKKRHHSRRLLLPPFINQLARIMAPQGELCFVTDDCDFAVATQALIDQDHHFENLYADGFVHHIEHYGSSTFEELWRSKGKQIRFHRWMRTQQRWQESHL